MSEYLSKKAVLESISEAYQTSLEDSDQADWEEGYRSALRFVKRTIQSGAFDADNSEVQRLRAALEMAQSELRWGDPANAIERVERIIDEALSTTSEPTNAAKVKRIECPCCGCEISINAPEGDGNDV